MLTSLYGFINKNNRALYIVLIIQIVIIYSAYLFIIPQSGGDKLLLRSDGYYEYAEKWVEDGEIQKNSVLAPGLPAVLSVLFLFPESLHPFLRITFSLLSAIGVILILYRLTKNHLSNLSFFIGSLFFIFNVTWLQWIIKLSPEVYISFLLGMYILFTWKYLNTNHWKYIVFANLVFVISVFTKPVLLLIPFALLAYAIFKKKLVAYSLIGIIVSLVAFSLYTEVTSFQLGDNEKTTDKSELIGYNSTVKGGFIIESFWYDFIIRTGQFHKGMKHHYEEGSFFETGYKEGKDYIQEYFSNNPEGGYIGLHWAFVTDHPWMALQNIFVSPIFFFIIGTTPLLSTLLVITTVFTFIILIPGLRKTYQLADLRDKEKMVVLFVILLGYSLTYLIFHAYSRYSHSLLPYLYVWCGNVIFYFSKRRKVQPETEIIYN